MLDFLLALPHQHIDWAAGPGYLAAFLIVVFGFITVMAVDDLRKSAP